MVKQKIGLLSFVALLALPLVGRTSVPVITQNFTSSSAAGSTRPFNPTGSTTCSIHFTSAGGSSVTVQGAVNSASGAYTVNTSFGTNGKIAYPETGSVWAGDVSRFPAGFMLSWAGNSATISGSITCFGQSNLTSGTAHRSSSLRDPSAVDPPTFFPLATSTPFLVTNSGTPSGTVAPWAFQATSSSCGPSNTNLIMQWENNTVSPGTAGAAYLSCNGNFTIVGAYSGTGSGLTGIPYSALPYAPFPIATSTPLLITNSESPAITGLAPYIFQATSDTCGDTNDSDLADFQNNGTEPVLRIACSTTSGTVLNGIIVGGDLTTKGIVNDGLPTPEPSRSSVRTNLWCI